MIVAEIGEDYILYEIQCDYCDKEYSIKSTDPKPREVVECCSFCGNLIEEPAERIHDDEIGWD